MSILNFRKLLIKSFKSTATVTARLVKRYVFNSDKVYAANVTSASYESPTFGTMPVVNFSTGTPVAYKVKNRTNFTKFTNGIKSLSDNLDSKVQLYDVDEYPCVADSTSPRYPTVFEAIFNETVATDAVPFTKETAPTGITLRLKPASGYTVKTGKWDYYGAEVMGVSTTVDSETVQFYVYQTGEILDLVAPEGKTVSTTNLTLNFTLPGFKTSTITLA